MTVGIERILDLSEAGAYLRVENHRLVIERRDEPAYSAPLDEIAVVVAAQSQMTLTQPVLAVPAEGQVRILSLTDHQFGKMEVFSGKKRVRTEKRPLQLEFF